MGFSDRGGVLVGNIEELGRVAIGIVHSAGTREGLRMDFPVGEGVELESDETRDIVGSYARLESTV